MRPLPLREQEYRESLYRLERRAIIPLKWGILLVSLVLWVRVIGSPLTPALFSLFFGYGLINCALTYFFYLNRVSSNQIRPFTLASYLADVIFVSMLVYFDLNTITSGTHSDFYVIYFLLVMRGFALFKTMTETIFVNFLISLLYILTFYLSDYDFHSNPNFYVSFVLIWLVILMSWLIVMVINRQKLELMEVHERLLRADSLSRVGELAAGVAHEINNPIGIIAATADYLRMQIPENDARREDVDAIHAEAMRCKQIVQEMLTYAHPRPAGVMAIEPCALNDEVLAFVFPGSRQEKYKIVRNYEDDPGLFNADPNMVKQALLNIYINAQQAIPEERMGRIDVRIERAENMVRFEIEDNGSGIADEDLEHIFDPFFTRKAKGTGLGLAVTQRIVEQFDGSISVRPAHPNGAIFSLEFPILAG